MRECTWRNLAVAALAFLAACGPKAAADIRSAPARPLAEVVTAETSEPATTSTLPAPTTTTTAAAKEADPMAGFGVGTSGPAVLSLEQKLDTLHYYVGTVDDHFDGDTRDGVLAFQKVTGLDRTGRANTDVIAAINAVKGPPAPIVPNGGLHRVEVDLDRQVLFLYDGNAVKTILNVSTGSNERFCSEGWCRVAVTPTGSFTIYDKHSGWETGPLGSLYNAQYFNGAIAIHGSTSVPAYPASHGCVRISMNAAEWFPDELIVGTPVYVASSDDPHPAPIGATPVTSTPTTIVPQAPSPTTSTTAPNLLTQLLSPPTTVKP